MRAAGRDHNEIAAEFAREFGYRPRAAYRYAHGWTLREAAAQMNTIAAHHGCDPDARATVAPSHLSEWEQWPTGGRKPTPYVLNLMALAYNTTVHQLLDFTDHQHLTARDRLTLNRPAPPIQAGTGQRGRDADKGAERAAEIRTGRLQTPFIDEHTVSSRGVKAPSPNTAVLYLDELFAHVSDQWHALVRTDNLLGPRHALRGVQSYVGVIENVLATERGAARSRWLTLGARYAESAAWLYEDGGNESAASAWTGRAMEWALEADDQHMVTWTLFRRSQQALTTGETAKALGLAEAARCRAQGAPAPMRAAVAQQLGRSHAVDGDERAAHARLDEALEFAADDHRGDARDGHGSFCTAEYVELQRAGCWLTLGRPRRAIELYERTLPYVSPVYQRDRSTAVARLATAHAAEGAPEAAAAHASEALDAAVKSGSARTLRTAVAVAHRLSGHSHLPVVAALLNTAQAVASRPES